MREIENKTLKKEIVFGNFLREKNVLETESKNLKSFIKQHFEERKRERAEKLKEDEEKYFRLAVAIASISPVIATIGIALQNVSWIVNLAGATLVGLSVAEIFVAYKFIKIAVPPEMAGFATQQMQASEFENLRR
jgi:hypothetical protein